MYSAKNKQIYSQIQFSSVKYNFLYSLCTYNLYTFNKIHEILLKYFKVHNCNILQMKKVIFKIFIVPFSLSRIFVFTVQSCIEENYDDPLRLLRQISLSFRNCTPGNPSCSAKIKGHVILKWIEQNMILFLSEKFTSVVCRLNWFVRIKKGQN